MDPKLVMEVGRLTQRFEKLMKNNDPEKGGSFYLQAKIFNAKELFMRDFPP